MSKRKQSWSPQKAWLGKKLLKVGGEIATATGHPIAGATADMMHNAIERSERQEMELLFSTATMPKTKTKPTSSQHPSTTGS